ncbi:hypothetical protein GCM10028801_08820 [Nocardioides maradonensis]
MTTRLAAVAAALLLLVGLGTAGASASPSVLMIWTNPHPIANLTDANHYLAGTGLGFRRAMARYGHRIATDASVPGSHFYVERYDSRGFASTLASYGDDYGPVWAKVDGVWKIITRWDRGQDVMCWALKKYGVPDQVLDAQPAKCQTTTGALVAYHHA